MDVIFSGLAPGFSVALNPFILMLVLVGCFLGTLIGALPGLVRSMPSRSCCRSPTG